MAAAQSFQSPIDDETYDLLQTLTSKLEAIDAYSQYEADSSGEIADLFRDLASQDRENVERIAGLVRDRFSTVGAGVRR